MAKKRPKTAKKVKRTAPGAKRPKRAAKPKKAKKAAKRPAKKVAKAKAFQALAVDIGASNGRAVLGTLSDDGILTTKEVRRFSNGMDEVDGSLRWDFDFLAFEVRSGIEDSFAQGERPLSVGIDTWGVDYVLLARDGSEVDRPFAYRDARTDGVMERFFKEVMPRERVYAVTGVQFMQINTLYQLYADAVSGGERLKRASKILLMPDAFAHSLTGKVLAEYTIASTSQMLEARSRAWSDELISALGIERDLFPDIAAPGTKAGTYRDPYSKKTLNVVLPGGHDTAAAVAAVPATGDRPWAYVSSGTWSLVGVETREPVLTDDAREAGVTNEGGVDGTYRLLRNVMGLWLLQECMRLWAEAGSPQDIVRVCEDAARAPVHGPLVDPDHELFLAPPNMLEALAEYCRLRGHMPPEGVGPTARCIFESLALKTRAVLERIVALTGTDAEVIHVVGGGSRNATLNQMIADATGRVVIAGPAEATATGNVLVQAMAAGRVESLEALREVVRNSFELRRFEPSGSDYWRVRYEQFRMLLP